MAVRRSKRQTAKRPKSQTKLAVVTVKAYLRAVALEQAILLQPVDAGAQILASLSVRPVRRNQTVAALCINVTHSSHHTRPHTHLAVRPREPSCARAREALVKRHSVHTRPVIEARLPVRPMAGIIAVAALCQEALTVLSHNARACCPAILWCHPHNLLSCLHTCSSINDQSVTATQPHLDRTAVSSLTTRSTMSHS